MSALPQWRQAALVSDSAVKRRFLSAHPRDDNAGKAALGQGKNARWKLEATSGIEPEYADLQSAA